MKITYSALLTFLFVCLYSGSLLAAEKIFPCPATGVKYASDRPVVQVKNPDESVTEWRITATVFPQGASQVSSWTRANAKHSSVSTELKCEEKVEDAGSDKIFYTTAVTDVEPTWKPCSVFDIPETSSKGFRCLSA